VESLLSLDFSGLYIVPCNPQPCDGGPERSREALDGGEETIVDDLADDFEKYVCDESE